jgi:putative ABC transport system permease protein
MSIANPFLTVARSFRRNPGFSAAVVLTLALGIAPNVVIFAIMDGVYFRPLLYPAQERLALVNVVHPSTAALDETDSWTFTEWRQRATGFESLAAYRGKAVTLDEGDRAERLAAQAVSGEFFRTLDAHPSLGREIGPGDCEPGAPGVVVISDRTFREYFGGRPGTLGRSVRIDGVPATVIGVMPARFTSFMEGRAAQAWIAMSLPGEARPGSVEPAGNVIGRLKPGTTLDGARAEIAAIQKELSRQFPEHYRDRRAAVRDFRGALFGGLGPGIRMLSVVVGLLLLIACANAANLLLGRALQRVKEVAIRAALGVGRAQLAVGMILENLLLALAAALVGLGLASWGTWLVWGWTAPIFQAIGVNEIAFDHRVVVFTLLLTLVTTLLFGVLPALRGSRADIGLVLKDAGAAGGGRRRGRMSRGLVVAQVALCVFTMIGTTLVLRSFLHYLRVAEDPGFHPRSLLVATLPHPNGGDAGPARSADVVAAAARVAGLPGVQGVALVDRIPFLEAGTSARAFTRGASANSEPGPRLDVELRRVDAAFFALMSMPLVKGRLLADADTSESEPVVVISDRLARAYWSGGDPVGERIQVDGTWRTIVGVVGSTIEPSPFQAGAREAFVPVVQSPSADLRMLIRSALPVASVAPAIRAQVRTVDPGQPVTDLRTLPQELSRFMTPFRLILVLMALFASIALALAAVGLYSVISRGVARRTREIGIRMALGADRRAVTRMVVTEGLRLAGVGLAVGLLLGMGLARVLPSEILGVRGLALSHYALAAAVWLGVAAAACLAPARSAAVVDPLVALRTE